MGTFWTSICVGIPTKETSLSEKVPSFQTLLVLTGLLDLVSRGIITWCIFKQLLLIWYTVRE